MLSVSSFESEGFPYCRRSRAEFLWLLDSLYHGQPGKFPEGDWYGFLFRRNPPRPHFILWNIIRQVTGMEWGWECSFLPRIYLTQPSNWKNSQVGDLHEIDQILQRGGPHLYKTQEAMTGLPGLACDLADTVSWQLKSWMLLVLNYKVNVGGSQQSFLWSLFFLRIPLSIPAWGLFSSRHFSICLCLFNR